MFDWLKFIGEFLLGIITSIPDLLVILGDALGVFYASFAAAPQFLVPILFIMVAVVVLMWVVNIF